MLFSTRVAGAKHPRSVFASYDSGFRHAWVPLGFTLVEMLVVIAVIAILAALLFPLGARMMKSSDMASGVAAMKNVGVAIAQYAGDNGMSLPSVMQVTEYVVKQKRGPGHDLMFHLAPYLGAAHLAATNYVPGTASKAFLRQADPLNVACYELSPYVRLADGTGRRFPFGYRAYGQTPVAPGTKLHLVDTPSRQVAAIDLDAQLKTIDGIPAGTAPWHLPNPVYGDRRLALFFDWHVETIPVGTNHYSDKRW